jgi:hypothetical protein
MYFISIFKFLLENLEREKIDFALIGGFALQASGIPRTTFDIDLLILSENSSKIKDIMTAHGYELMHESEEALNFYGKKIELGRVDFMLAHRKYSIEMLKRAKKIEVFEGRFKIKVIRPEDQIGLKVQSSSNDPDRFHKDMADIEVLIKNNYPNLDINLLREYFKLFDREKELDEILDRIKYA